MYVFFLYIIYTYIYFTNETKIFEINWIENKTINKRTNKINVNITNINNNNNNKFYYQKKLIPQKIYIYT